MTRLGRARLRAMPSRGFTRERTTERPDRLGLLFPLLPLAQVQHLVRWYEAKFLIQRPRRVRGVKYETLSGWIPQCNSARRRPACRRRALAAHPYPEFAYYWSHRCTIAPKGRVVTLTRP